MRTDNLRASLWMVAAMALFAFEDLFLKQMTSAWPTGQIILVFGVAGSVMWGLLARRNGDAAFTRAFFHPTILLRNASEALGSMAWITALASIPLATVSAILQSAPLMVTMGAALFLGETVGWRRWSAIGVGMVGVLMILRPGPEGLQLPAVLAVFSVLCLTARDLVTRIIPATTGTFQLTCWAYVWLVPAGGALMAMNGDGFATLSRHSVTGLVAAFLLGAAGYYGVTHAMRIGEASAVAPYRYARLVCALAIAMIVLGERPDGWVLAGAALVVTSGLYTFARARAQARSLRASPAPGDGL